MSAWSDDAWKMPELGLEEADRVVELSGVEVVGVVDLGGSSQTERRAARESMDALLAALGSVVEERSIEEGCAPARARGRFGGI